VTCGRSVVFSGYSGFLHQKTDRHDIAEILLKVALKTISLNQTIKYCGVKQHVPFTSTGSTEEKYIRVREPEGAIKNAYKQTHIESSYYIKHSLV
jgi:hypothetical protein